MSATPTKPAAKAKKQKDKPPEEQFWIRYSPHHELPISGLASLAWHVGAGVLLLVIAFVVARNRDTDMPIETVAFPGGGGAGTGTGPGTGSGEGPGEINTRTKRKLRWTITFNTTSGDDYLRQLNTLGAILAFRAPDGELKVVRELLRRPAKFVSEDVKK